MTKAVADEDPMRELMALLDWIGRRVSRNGYRGCPQINVAAEFSDLDHPARKIRARHKQAMFERLKALLRRMGLDHPDEAAYQIALLIDGAFTSEGRLSRVGATRILQPAARTLVGNRDSGAVRRARQLRGADE